MMGFSRRRKGVLGGAEGEPWWERWVEGTTVTRSLQTPAWGAGKDQEGVRRREPWAGPRHRLAREQGPPSPSAGLAEKRLDGHPPDGRQPELMSSVAHTAHASLPGVFAGSHPVRLASLTQVAYQRLAQRRPGPTGARRCSAEGALPGSAHRGSAGGTHTQPGPFCCG